MPVRFCPWAGADNAQGPPGVAGTDVPWADQSLTGDFASVVSAFSGEPRYRRVVLGEGGAGKTVLVMEFRRKLLEAPGADGPLPVLVSASAWNPDRQSLLDWLAGQLAEDNAWLPVTHARALVASGSVLPILDGLDEVPGSLRPSAIARINKHHVYRPLVVTCREEAYRESVRQSRAGINGAGIVAVQPLPPADIRTYLDPAGSGRWARVFAKMDDDSGRVLAEVLANPLMLWLARVVYGGETPDGLTVFGSRESLENHLLDEFIPAVYAADPRRPTARQFRCTVQQAERWLGHLFWDSYVEHEIGRGRRADAPRMPGLAWWRLSQVAGRWRLLGTTLRAAVLCGVAAALLVWVLARHGNWRHGVYSGPVNFGDLLLGGPVGRLIRPTMQWLALTFPSNSGRSVQAATAELFRGRIFSIDVLLVAANAAIVVGVVFWLSWAGSRVPVRLEIRARSVFARAVTGCSVFFIVSALAAFLVIHGSHRAVSAGAFFSSRSTWITLLAL